jgi:hypothetical protein
MSPLKHHFIIDKNDFDVVPDLFWKPLEEMNHLKVQLLRIGSRQLLVATKKGNT